MHEDTLNDVAAIRQIRNHVSSPDTLSIVPEVVRARIDSVRRVRIFEKCVPCMVDMTCSVPLRQCSYMQFIWQWPCMSSVVRSRERNEAVP